VPKDILFVRAKVGQQSGITQLTIEMDAQFAACPGELHSALDAPAQEIVDIHSKQGPFGGKTKIEFHA